MLESIKKFWIRHILRKVYNAKEVVDGTIAFHDMNRAERKLYFDVLKEGLLGMQNTMQEIINYIAKIPTTCDKCDNYTDPGSSLCSKCENSGVIKNKHLCDWHWQN